MPPNERVGMHDRQQLPPGYESRQQHKGDTGRVIRAPGSDVALETTMDIADRRVFDCDDTSMNPYGQPFW